MQEEDFDEGYDDYDWEKKCNSCLVGDKKIGELLDEYFDSDEWKIIVRRMSTYINSNTYSYSHTKSDSDHVIEIKKQEEAARSLTASLHNPDNFICEIERPIIR